MKSQTIYSNDEYLNSVMSKKTLEINPYNSIIKKINKKIIELENNHSDLLEEKIINFIYLLYEVSIQSIGLTIENPNSFSNRIFKLIDFNLDNDFI
jgi:molecular chaperone HtpG